MMIALYVLAALFALFVYIQIGYWFGRWSWHVWTTEEDDSFSARLLFPLVSRFGDYGRFNNGTPGIGIFYERDELPYCYVMCAFWPAKFVWCFVSAALVVPVCLFGKRALWTMIHGPETLGKMVRRMVDAFRGWSKPSAQQEKSASFKEAIDSLPTSSPVVRVDQIDTEIARLQAERAKLNTRPDARP